MIGSIASGLGLTTNQLGAAGGGILGFIGQERTNKANWDLAHAANVASAEQAGRQMDFQERMRSTQYQTAVADMIAAGLNPMLAYTQGGAGTPSGAMGQVSTAKVGNSIGSALAGYQTMAMNNAEVDLKDATTKGTTAQTVKTEADTIKTAAEIAYILENVKLNQQQQKNLEGALEKITQEIANLKASEKYTTASTANVQANIAPSVDPFWYRDFKAGIRRLKEGYKSNPSLVSPVNAAENIYKSGRDWARQKYQQYTGGQK